MKEICSSCGKLANYSSGLCQACYSKKWRNTPKGKAATKLYNNTKGRENRKRYLASLPPKPPKPIKPPKGNCECGSQATIKEYCKKCYHKYYSRRKFGFKDISRKKYLKFNKTTFKKILSHVKNGYTIQKSCALLNIDRNVLYKMMSDVQKMELKSYKTIGIVIDDNDTCE